MEQIDDGIIEQSDDVRPKQVIEQLTNLEESIDILTSSISELSHVLKSVCSDTAKDPERPKAEIVLVPLAERILSSTNSIIDLEKKVLKILRNIQI
jgi:hypothetical protein